MQSRVSGIDGVRNLAHDFPMPTSAKPRRLSDAYRVAGFRTRVMVRGVFGDPQARVVTLARRSKTPSVGSAAERIERGTTAPCVVRAYGLRDEEYLRLKVLTCMLPAL